MHGSGGFTCSPGLGQNQAPGWDCMTSGQCSAWHGVVYAVLQICSEVSSRLPEALSFGGWAAHHCCEVPRLVQLLFDSVLSALIYFLINLSQGVGQQSRNVSNAGRRTPFGTIFAVGDNPKADIAGANAAGTCPWLGRQAEMVLSMLQKH